MGPACCLAQRSAFPREHMGVRASQRASPSLPALSRRATGRRGGSCPAWGADPGDWSRDERGPEGEWGRQDSATNASSCLHRCSPSPLSWPLRGTHGPCTPLPLPAGFISPWPSALCRNSETSTLCSCSLLGSGEPGRCWGLLATNCPHYPLTGPSTILAPFAVLPTLVQSPGISRQIRGQGSTPWPVVPALSAWIRGSLTACTCSVHPSLLNGGSWGEADRPLPGLTFAPLLPGAPLHGAVPRATRRHRADPADRAGSAGV